MGFWGTLGKIGLAAAPFIAAPFTGGASLLGAAATGGSKLGSILGTAGKIGGAISPVLGGAAKGRAEGRVQEENAALQRDLLEQRGAEMNMKVPGQRMSNVARGALMGAGPVSLNWGGPGSGMKGKSLQATGGFMGAMADPRMKQLADSVMQRDIEDQLSGKMPWTGATPAPESNWIDKALGIGSMAAGGLGALNAAGVFNRDPEEERQTAVIEGSGLPPEPQAEDYGIDPIFNPENTVGPRVPSVQW